jgi:hypothetical protein
MGISSIVSRVLPVAIAAVTGGPAAAFTTAISVEEQKKAEKKQKQQINARNAAIRQENAKMAEIFGTGNVSSVQQPMYGQRVTTQQAGFGSGFGSFLSDVGSNIVSPLSNIFSQVRPFISQQSVGQPALPTRTNLGGQESQSSGVTEGFVGGIPNILGQAARFLRTPGGQIGTGLVGGIGASMLSGGNGGMRITRKMKSQYRAVLNLAQGDYDQAASMIGVSTDFFIMVLLKRFRNDGPVVTKAALRKTKTTVRRLKSMCDMYDSLRPTATRRKAPMRRASTTLISNK